MSTAIVIGGANSAWSDLDAARKLCTFDHVVCVNHAGIHYDGPVSAWASYHVELLWRMWIPARASAGNPTAESYWTAMYRGRRLGPRVPLKMRTLEGAGGSSGLLGARVGAALADRVVLCGIPMDASYEHYDKPGPWKECDKYRRYWEEKLPEIGGKVRSMGGWSAELLGKPDAEWLAGKVAA